VFHQPPLLSVCYDGSLFFSCFSVLWGSLALGVAYGLRRWFLWSSTCPALGIGLLPTSSPPFCLSSVSLLIVLLRLAFYPSPFLWCTFSVPTPSAVVLDYSSLFVIQFFWGGVSLPRGCAGLSQGWLGKFCMIRGTHLFVLSNVSQAGLEPMVAAVVVVVMAALPCWLYSRSQLLGAIKGWLLGQSLIFSHT
jgi:hypothetical protein